MTKLQARRIYGVRYVRGRYATFFFLHMLLSSMPCYASLYASSTYAYNILSVTATLPFLHTIN